MTPEQISESLIAPYRNLSTFGYDLPAGLVLVWLSSGPGRQLEFDLETDEACDRFVFWWLQSGKIESPGTRDALERHLLLSLHLRQPPEMGQSRELTITALMRLVWRNRGDLVAAFDIKTPEGVAGLWYWWLSAGHSELFGDSGWFMAEELDALHQRFLSETGRSQRLTITPLMRLVWRNRPDLFAAFDIETPEGVAGLWHWWLSHGQNELHLLGPVAHRATKLNNGKKVDRTKNPPRKNVALIGYPQGEFGLGEDIRLLQASLQEVGIHPEVIRTPWKLNARENAVHSAVGVSQAEFECDIMLYAMPAFDTVGVLNRVGPKAFAARRKIGFWQWELELFPEHARLAIDLVDEIWCHSEHAARAFRAATQKPVIKVPLPVSVPKPKKVPRSVFGLPKDAFVVFTAFDGSSHIARKNPLASILAFQAAFPTDAGTNACLVVKAMNTNNDSLWRECLRKAELDRRIRIFEAVWDRAEYYECLRNCDVVISLHRAEGFGRLMAEAMALGIPVIATKYSGNLDFMTEENSWLVEGDLIPVLAGDYPFHKNQVWCEPRVGEAARILRQCAKNTSARNARSALARSDITERYSLAFCGKTYSKLLGVD